jgi:hypothetical protein
VVEALKIFVRIDPAKPIIWPAIQCALGLGLLYYGTNPEYLGLAAMGFLACAFVLVRVPGLSDLDSDKPSAQSGLRLARRIIAIGVCLYIVGVGLSCLLTAIVSPSTFYRYWWIFVVALAWAPVAATLSLGAARAKWGK